MLDQSAASANPVRPSIAGDAGWLRHQCECDRSADATKSVSRASSTTPSGQRREASDKQRPSRSRVAKALKPPRSVLSPHSIVSHVLSDHALQHATLRPHGRQRQLPLQPRQQTAVPRLSPPKHRRERGTCEPASSSASTSSTTAQSTPLASRRAQPAKA